VTFDISTVICGDSRPKWPGFEEHVEEGRVIWGANGANEFSPCQMYQGALDTTKADIIIYMHNDLEINDPDWLDKVLHIFQISDAVAPKDGRVVAVGLGGALALGNMDLYRKSFDIRNMARRRYASNQDDAEFHGERFTEVRRVAVIEQFFMAIRTDWLRKRLTRKVATKASPYDYEMGWPTTKLFHHGLDMWVACEAARSGDRIYMNGISCHHHGGGVSVSESYNKAKWLGGRTPAEEHRDSHLWLANQYTDVLPIEVNDKVPFNPKQGSYGG